MVKFTNILKNQLLNITLANLCNQFLSSAIVSQNMSRKWKRQIKVKKHLLASL